MKWLMEMTLSLILLVAVFVIAYALQWVLWEWLWLAIPVWIIFYFIQREYGIMDKAFGLFKKLPKKQLDREELKNWFKEYGGKNAKNQLKSKHIEKASKDTISVLGVELDPENFPKLYRWAKENPATLESRLQSIADAWHEGSISSAAVALESDLQHG